MDSPSTFPSAATPAIPDVELLLHADCDELEVLCEISRYSHSHTPGDEPGPAHFFVTLDLEGSGLSISLVLQTLQVQKKDPAAPPTSEDLGHRTPLEERLGLPLSDAGSLLTEGQHLNYFHNV